MKLNELGEFGLIERIAGGAARRPGVLLGIGDDAAVLEPLSHPVVTTDTLVEGVHYRRDWSTPHDLGRKSIAVNVSDIAAMGGRPVAAFINLALGPRDDAEFVGELYDGMEAAAAQYGLTIAGGDTVRSHEMLVLSVTVVGNAPNPVTRAGARPGDVLLVTGYLGDAAAGLELLRHDAIALDPAERAYLLRRHLDPSARVVEMAAGLAAQGDAVHAALDLSDGLSGDARHIAKRSGVSLEIEMARLPLTAACKTAAVALGQDPLQWALTGGEDYELLLLVAPDAATVVAKAIQQATGTQVSAIGRCVANDDEAPANGPRVYLINANGERQVAPPAFTHF